MSIAVKVGELPELGELERVWRDLERRSSGRFFVSWAWIGVWLANLPHDWPLRLIRAERFGKTVGLGILAGGEPKKIWNIPYCATEHLHETGVREIDMVIEHNDFLLNASYENEVRSAMIGHWLDSVEKVSELGVPGTSQAGWKSDEIDHERHDMKRFDMTMKSHAMDLEVVRRVGGDPVTILDARTRAKIRRAMREYAQLGELRIATAATIIEALEWLDSLEMLHQKRWTAKGESGCFSNPRFLLFHRMMIARNHENGSATVMRINVGDAALGYLYGFSDKQRFYVYQCGFDYEMVERNSMPGLVCHVMAMRHLAETGLQLYDFMAGFSGYKSSLSNVEENMTWTIFRSESLRFRVVEYARPAIARIHHHKKRLMSKWRGIRSISPRPSNTPINQGI
jgi:hypothetical protein